MSEEIELVEKKKRDLWFIDPRHIFVEEGFNTRMDFDIDELVISIRQNGIHIPLTLWKVSGEEKYYIVDGERRWRAAMQLVNEGTLVLCPAITITKPNDENRTLMLLTKNDGKRLTPIELAHTYFRLKNYGYSEAEIAQKTGRSVQHVYQMLDIANLPKAVQDDIIKGEISAHKVIEVQKQLKDPESITAVVAKAKEKRAKLDTVPNESGECCLKEGSKKVSKIELDAKEIEDELMAEGVKKTTKVKVTCCQNCPFAGTREKNNELEVFCVPVSNKSMPYYEDELIVTDEYQNAKLHKDCGLKRYKFAIELN
jgi:ParB family chromosome partitioning protein